MRADIDLHVAALADEAHGAPDLGAADGIQPRLRVAGGIQGQVGVASVGQLLDRGDRVVRPRIHHLVGAEFLGALQPRRADIERDHSRAHRLGVLRAGQSDRSLAEDRNRIIPGQVHPAQCAIGGARSARDRRTGGERQLVGQRHQRVGRHLQILRVPAMRVGAVDLHRDLLAKLLPAGAAMIALRAALVVVHHHPLADACLLRIHARADGEDHTARLVPGDHRIGVLRKPGGGALAAFRTTVLVQVAAAHARGFHFDNHLVGARGGIGKFHQFELAFSGEHHAAHLFLLWACCFGPGWPIDWPIRGGFMMPIARGRGWPARQIHHRGTETQRSQRKRFSRSTIGFLLCVSVPLW